MIKHRLRLACSIFAVCVSVLSVVPRIRSAAASLPLHLSDQDFWKLVSDSSEPTGSFRSDNLLSNESWFQYVIPDLAEVAKPGRVYLGVGPEQNFTYIVAVRPAMAFIVDVRRGNLDLQLMYKTLFELSGDRADFVSRLFSKPRPTGLSAASTVSEIFTALANVDASQSLYNENLKTIRSTLVAKHGFAVTEDDLAGIEYVYHAFYTFGPGIQYSSTGSFGGRSQPTYADLMEATDERGRAHGYLASEPNFKFMKDLESRNMLVPLVGNFAGPKALRAVGRYLSEKGATVSAFYLSNVEQYLIQDRIWDEFCANVATLPLDESSTFIRAVRGGGGGAAQGFGLNSELGPMAPEVKSCGPARR